MDSANANFAGSSSNSTFILPQNSTQKEVDQFPYVFFVDLFVALGIVGNLMNILLMTSSSLRGHSFSVYVICLATSDSIVLTNIAVEDTMDHIYGTLHQMLSSSLSFCKFWNFFVDMVLITSPWFLLCMSVDRYVNIVLSRYKIKFCRVKVSLIICSLVFFVAGIFTSPLTADLQVVHTKPSFECVEVHKSIEQYSVFVTIVLTSSLPVFITFALNIRIALEIYRWYKHDPAVDERKARRLSFSLVFMSVLSTLTLMPNAIISVAEFMYMLRSSSEDVDPFDGPWKISNVIRTINYGMNFYILICFSEFYRDVLISRWRCCPGVCQERTADGWGERKGLTHDPSVSDHATNDDRLNRPAGHSGDVVVASLRGLEDPEYLLIGGSEGSGPTRMSTLTNVDVS